MQKTVSIKFRPNEIDDFVSMAVDLSGAAYHYDPDGSTVTFTAAQLKEFNSILMDALRNEELVSSAEKVKIRSALSHVRSAITTRQPNPLDVTTRNVLLGVAAIGALGTVAYFLSSKPAASSPTTGGAAPATTPILQVNPGSSNDVSLVIGNTELETPPGVLFFQVLDNALVTVTASSPGIVTITTEAGLANGFQITAVGEGTTTLTTSDGAVLNITVYKLTFAEADAGSHNTYVGATINFELDTTPDAGYQWSVTFSGNYVFGTPAGPGMMRGAYQTMTAQQAGTETVTFTQVDSSGNANPNALDYSFTFVAS